jgi:glycine dehydrogenase subunit 1
MRYLGLTNQDREEMLKAIGVKSVNELYDAAPDAAVLKKPIENLSSHLGEIEVETFIKNLSEKNRHSAQGPFFLGAGCYNHHIPAAVDHIIQRSEFLTSYTPYQPEIAQGTLATIFQFQSIIALLTGMEVSNASMYDGSTSLSEAVLMALRIKKDRKNVNIHGFLNPDYRDVLTTYAELCDANIIDNDKNLDEKTACLIVQYPDFHGNIEDLNQLRKKCDAVGALMIVCVTEVLALGLIEAPSQADIVVGEASSIGVGMNFGGPHLGFFACKKENVRQMPGRICGVTTDENGEEGYVLTLNAREQHIRREKATSNICSNQGLCATAFTIHTSLLGEIGFKKLALLNHKIACDLAARLEKVKGVKIINENFFNEFTIELSKDSEIVNKELLKRNIIGGRSHNKQMVVAATELTKPDDIEKFAAALEEILN